MPRRKPQERGTRGKSRGRHKRASSPETKRWESEHLIPKRPSWMSQETYQKLRKIREAA